MKMHMEAHMGNNMEGERKLVFLHFWDSPDTFRGLLEVTSTITLNPKLHAGP